LAEQTGWDEELGAGCEVKAEAGGGPWNGGGISTLERELRMKIRSDLRYRAWIYKSSKNELLRRREEESLGSNCKPEE